LQITALIFRGSLVHLIRADVTQDYINGLISVDQANFDSLNIEVSPEYDLHDERDPPALTQRIIDVFTGHERRVSGGIWEVCSGGSSQVTEA
jgi:hypothetical protein